jgi:hypothetical protein
MANAICPTLLTAVNKMNRLNSGMFSCIPTSHDLLVAIGFGDNVFYNRDCHEQPAPIFSGAFTVEFPAIAPPTQCEN